MHAIVPAEGFLQWNKGKCKMLMYVREMNLIRCRDVPVAFHTLKSCFFFPFRSKKFQLLDGINCCYCGITPHIFVINFIWSRFSMAYFDIECTWNERLHNIWWADVVAMWFKFKAVPNFGKMRFLQSARISERTQLNLTRTTKSAHAVWQTFQAILSLYRQKCTYHRVLVDAWISSLCRDEDEDEKKKTESDRPTDRLNE